VFQKKKTRRPPAKAKIFCTKKTSPTATREQAIIIMESFPLGKSCTPRAILSKFTTQTNGKPTPTPWPTTTLQPVQSPPTHIKRQLVTSNFTCEQRSIIYFWRLLLLQHCCVIRRPRRITQHTHNNQRLLWAGT